MRRSKPAGLIVSNPIAKAIEKARVARWQEDTEMAIRSLKHGQQCGSLLSGLAEVLGTAMKATEDCDDPANVRGLITEALRHLSEMAQAGAGWDSAAAELIAEAADYSCQIVSASSPSERLEAWAHVQAVQCAARQSAEAVSA